ncbi:MAG: hypothetical protein EON98_04195 [Chitinophagaceae bacterium]|nr:MAG: hypothetical protein EON98_04195 [Chitinophagaceae bacterium]
MYPIKYIIRKRALGDVLWTEPVIRSMAEKYKKLIVYTKYPVLFQNYPWKNVVFTSRLSFFEKIILKADSILGLHWLSLDLDQAYETKPHTHFLHAYQQTANLPVTREYPRLYLSPTEENHRIEERPYVVLHIESFSNKAYRQVVGIDWEQVVLFFKERGFQVLQVGVKENVLSGARFIKTTIRELLSLLRHADYFVGIDSGPSHLASSLGIRSLLLFSAIDPSLRHFPDLMNGIILKQSCEHDCTNYDVQSEAEHFCSAKVNGIPRCCIFDTGKVLVQLGKLLKEDTDETNQ